MRVEEDENMRDGRNGYLENHRDNDDATEEGVGENAGKHVDLVRFPRVDFVENLQTRGTQT